MKGNLDEGYNLAEKTSGGPSEVCITIKTLIVQNRNNTPMPNFREMLTFSYREASPPIPGTSILPRPLKDGQVTGAL